MHFPIIVGGVGGTVASESTLRSAGTLLSWVRAPPPAPWPDGGPESLRSPCCGLAIYKNQIPNPQSSCSRFKAVQSLGKTYYSRRRLKSTAVRTCLNICTGLLLRISNP
ncbi:hypothetical protein PoB_007560600 [Plakobranchus ocellatus]|uniref:Uncharacterized protein n=1 Tax=Plakobranchus ocellatus TaxID=259542 RepID=A0AAV4DYC5_9GAST|nr:hypothetical protein PoB_007560600 [Plakobranchus ocellatus]